MAEVSYLWTTDGTGDGEAGGYTQVHWSAVGRVLAGGSGWEGVVPGYLNELACTANGANTVAVNTGGAMVDGKPYYNSASVDVDIPSASGAGNTRIDRIVLRASWAAQTVRITRIAGTDAATPSAPSITQTSGTTYDILLCQVLVDTAGNVTVTDERVWAQGDDNSLSSSAVTTVKLATGAVTSAKIAADAVTGAKIADDAVDGAKIADDAVDSEHIAAGAIDTEHIASYQVTGTKIASYAVTAAKLAEPSIVTAKIFDRTITEGKIATSAVTTVKLADNAVTSAKLAASAVTPTKLAADSVTGTAAGNRIIQIHRRQGGSATNWSLYGDDSYTPTLVRMQVGAKRWTGTAASTGSVTVTFPTAFSYIPIVLATTENNYANVSYVVNSASAATLSWRTVDDSTLTSLTIFWLAIGPE